MYKNEIAIFCKDFLSHSMVSDLVLETCRVPHGPVVKCLTHNPGVLGSSRTGSSGFFLWECL